MDRLARLARSRWFRLGGLVLVGIAVVLAAWIVASRPQAPDRSLERVRAAGVLVVGVDPSYPPFEVDDGRGHLAGFDVDLATRISQRLGVSVRFVSIDFGSMVDALEVGKLDAIIGGVSPFPEYARELGYSSSYFDDGLVLVTSAAGSHRVLGIESGSDADLNQDLLRQRVPGYRWQQYDDPEQIHGALAQGEIGAAIVDAATALRWARESTALIVHERRLISAPFVIAVRRSDQNLLKAIDAAIAALRASGDLSRLEQEWLTR